MIPSQLPTLAVGLLAVVGAASCLPAQTPQQVNGRLLPAGVDTFMVSYNGNLIGRGIMARSRVGGTQGRHLMQVYEWRSATGDVVVDSLLSDEASLRPVREVRVTTDAVVEVTFGSDSIHVDVRPAGSPERRSIPGARAVYSSASLEALAAASPLSPSFLRDVRVYYAPPSQLGFAAIKLRVTGSEQVSDRSGVARDAWAVSVDTPDGGTTYWIDKATRAVLKYDVREGPATIEFRR